MEKSFKFIQKVSLEYTKLAADDNLVVQKLNAIPKNKIKERMDEIPNQEKIGAIRFETLKLLKENGKVAKEDIELIKQQVNSKYEKNILRTWTSYFRLFHSVFFNSIKEKTQNALNEISETIIVDLELKGIVDKKIVDFRGASQFGLERCWMAFYNKQQPSQKESLQLFINLKGSHIEYGLYQNSKKNFLTRNEVDTASFDYTEMISFLKESKEMILLDTTPNYWKFSPGERAEFWVDMFEKGLASLGWGANDFSQKSRLKIREILGEKIKPGQRYDDIIYRLSQVEKGDYIFAFKGRDTVVGFGVVKQTAKYSQDLLIQGSDHHNYIKVQWEKLVSPIKLKKQCSMDALANITKRKDEFDSIILKKGAREGNKVKGLNSKNQKNYSLNRILYGPPGTGKTYNTVNKAVDICRADNDNFPSCADHKSEGHQTKCYECAKEAYKLLKKKGRIEFVTFHQSYGYEEFIEGIRAETIENSDGTSSISYDVQPGVFKRISQLAGKNSGYNKSGIKEFTDVFKDAVINKVSKDEKLEITMTRSRYFIKEVTERTIFFDKDKGESQHSLSIKTLQKIYDAGSNQIIVGGLQPYYEALLQYLNECSQVTVQEEKKTYVLIIDEINRGNMSKIFGELITLIEDDKRLGKPNEMTVRLPNSPSETPFGVPSNLYIIGTMNTADRSIAMMDTALRRRFEFEEMMPDAEVFDDFGTNGIITVDLKDGTSFKLNLKDMLNKINQRIEVLYDREHTIGHAYFMSLKESPTIDKLSSIFRNKVIPLLAEYFFEDWEKIRMVLGDNQKENSKHQFVIEKESVKYKDLFGPKVDVGFDDERKVYERNVQALERAESYIGIYTQLATDKASKTQDSEPLK